MSTARVGAPRVVTSLGVSVLLLACATGGSSGDPPVDAAVGLDGAPTDGAPPTDAPDVDAPPTTDAAVTDAAVTDAAVTDAAVTDAAVTDAASPDAMVTDAGTDACTPITTQLLINPAFDNEPVGTGWTQVAFDPSYPLITPDDGIPEHTAPYKAWLGGLFSFSDDMYQQVTVPAGTTMLVVRGQYEVRTGESGTTVYDRGWLELVNSSNGLLQGVLTLTNATPTTAWTPFQLQFASPYAGQVVRLRLRSTNDFSLATSFYFDSFQLEATIGCP